MQKKFAEFTISTHTYKVVEGHSILVDVAVPKKLLDTQGNERLIDIFGLRWEPIDYQR